MESEKVREEVGLLDEKICVCCEGENTSIKDPRVVVMGK